MLGGRTDALSVYLLWMKAEIKSKNSLAPVEPMPYGACTGALKQAWTLCQNSNGYNLDTERPVEPTPQNRHPSVLPVLTVFLQWTSNGYVTPSTLYKGTPWLISVAFDTLNT